MSRRQTDDKVVEICKHENLTVLTVLWGFQRHVFSSASNHLLLPRRRKLWLPPHRHTATLKRFLTNVLPVFGRTQRSSESDVLIIGHVLWCGWSNQFQQRMQDGDNSVSRRENSSGMNPQTPTLLSDWRMAPSVSQHGHTGAISVCRSSNTRGRHTIWHGTIVGKYGLQYLISMSAHINSLKAFQHRATQKYTREIGNLVVCSVCLRDIFSWKLQHSPVAIIDLFVCTSDRRWLVSPRKRHASRALVSSEREYGHVTNPEARKSTNRAAE